MWAFHNFVAAVASLFVLLCVWVEGAQVEYRHSTILLQLLLVCLCCHVWVEQV